jgi:uncharacterized membrane protein (UPF0127 family)
MGDHRRTSSNILERVETSAVMIACPSMRASAGLLVLLAVAGWDGGCRNGRSGASPGGATAVVPGGPAVVLHAGARAFPFAVELARTEAERERGLMYRNHLEPSGGMLFIFEHDGPLTFWMKNTFIPLDMIFIDRNRRVVGIVEEAAPETETPRRVSGESRYVLEIVGGLSRRLGVVAGSSVEFQDIPGLALPN